MIVTEKELQRICKRVDNMLFEPITKLLEEKEDNSKRKVFKYEILKTAEEVYKEWLKNKDNPPILQPTKEEVMRAKLLKDNADIQLKLAEQQKFNADLLLKLAKLGGSTNV